MTYSCREIHFACSSKQIVESMSEQQLEEFAHTKHKGKPEHVDK